VIDSNGGSNSTGSRAHGLILLAIEIGYVARLTVRMIPIRLLRRPTG
jgi:hypothetical protein